MKTTCKRLPFKASEHICDHYCAGSARHGISPDEASAHGINFKTLARSEAAEHRLRTK